MPEAVAPIFQKSNLRMNTFAKTHSHDIKLKARFSKQHFSFQIYFAMAVWVEIELPHAQHFNKKKIPVITAGEFTILVKDNILSG